ncbi:MAG: cyclic nucleotide-binding domain-containing protein [Treponema sp.]|nr:cyclic nucleotide-binding domain-containing protein [Treponema sp.]MBR4631189.1 cyclic nucleotide-binding domain-containing protein [Treponema sp.]
MKKILTATANKDVAETIKNACKTYSSYFECDIYSDTEQVINYIDFEMPEIKVIDFSSPEIDGYRIIAAINADPWLHYGGIIAVCKDGAQVQAIEERKDSNILIVCTVKNFMHQFSRILRILWQNQHFLFSRGMQDIVGGQESGSFVSDNDMMDIRFYSNFLVSYLYNTNRIGEEERFNLQMSLMELLTNALEHGNLEISYAEKTEWMMSGGDMMELMQKRASMSEFMDRKIYIEYQIGKTMSKFTIRDCGEGFDWRKAMEAKADDEELHGRGIGLSKSLVLNLSYNEKGNEVSFEIKNIVNKTNSVPGIMKPFETVKYTDKQVVCLEHEESNDLFFIVSGRFAVYSGRKLVSILTPNDMFIGEMAFLLNDRRSATVLAVGDCTLIRIPKGAFLSLIRRNPHYGIFLSKMLAQRLQVQTQKTIQLSRKLNAGQLSSS